MEVSEEVFEVLKKIDVEIYSSMIGGSEQVKEDNIIADYVFFNVRSAKTKVNPLTTTFMHAGFKTAAMFVKDNGEHISSLSEFCKSTLARYESFMGVEKNNKFLIRFA